MKSLCSYILRFLFPAPSAERGWLADLTTCLLRLVFGWQLLQTGLGKLQHLDRTTEYFASLHLAAPHATAIGIGALETVGGILLPLGLASRPIALLLAGSMIGAILSAHRADVVADGLDGLFAAPPFPYLVAMVVIVGYGAGRLALDAIVARRIAAPVA